MIIKTPFASESYSEKPSVLSEVYRILCLGAAFFILLSLLSYSTQDASWTTWSTQFQIKNWMGRTGSIVADILFQTFGLWSFSIIGIFFNSSRNGRREFSLKKFFHTALFLFAGCLALQTFWTSQFVPWKLSRVGGIFGSLLYECSHFLFSHYGTILFSIVFFLTTTLLLFEISITENAKKASASLSVLFKKIKFQIQLKRTHLKAKQEAAVVEIEPAAEVLEEEVLAFEPDEENGISVDKEFIAEKKVIPKRKTKNFSLPQLNLLSGKAENKVKTVDKNWYIEKSQILVQKLKDFGVEGEVVHISPGPVITVYEFKPASGVKIKDIANLSDDLTLALSVLSVRIVAPIPGKPVVGIEIPSPHREMVYFKDLIQETHFFDGGLKIPILLGRSASGEPIATDLSQMPHLLIAGTTGTGKSVFINTLICSLLYRFTPKELKLILVDPKMVELSHYEGIPHLLLPVVVDYKKAVLALRWTVEEMERRYTLMHQSGVRHIDSYNEKMGEEDHLPYIVVVIDEYADLMAVVPKEVELSIARLAQKARASGIHLVLATQRPSTDVVTGTIKANFPSRISFRVASSVDSKTILDRTGADRLLGHGDLLFHSAGFASLKRMQGPFMSDADTARVVEFLKQQGEPEYDERILQAPEEGLEPTQTEFESEEENKLYDAAVRIVTEKGEASISLIQRHLRIGYNRAATLMEQLEKEGVVGGATGPAKRRSVLVQNI